MLQALLNHSRFRHFQTHQIWSMYKSICRNYRNWGLSNSKRPSRKFISSQIKIFKFWNVLKCLWDNNR
uniref:Ovule protein n=1 Tax=Meloidogyne incognita TaxID=6306 RepID=A0A914L894_MELIC